MPRKYIKNPKKTALDLALTNFTIDLTDPGRIDKRISILHLFSKEYNEHPIAIIEMLIYRYLVENSEELTAFGPITIANKATAIYHDMMSVMVSVHKQNPLGEGYLDYGNAPSNVVGDIDPSPDDKIDAMFPNTFKNTN